MAVNPNIALSVKGLELPDPLAQYAKVQQIRSAQQQNALAQMQMQQVQREQEQRNALRDFVASGVTPENREQLLGFGTQGREMYSTVLSGEREARQAEVAQEELATKRLANARNLLPGVTTPEQYREWRTQTVKQLPGLAQLIPEQFSPEVVQSLMQDADEQLQRSRPTTQFVDLPGGGKAAMRVVPGQAPVELKRYEASMTPAQKQQAETDQRRLALEKRRIALQEKEQDPAFQQAKAAALQEGKLAAGDVNTAINTTPAILEEAGRGISILTQMIGERDAQGKLVPGSKPHPGFENAVGFGPPGARLVPGTEASNFDSLFNQIQGQAFLQAFERLKGAGQITETEGQKATQAITSLSLAQSEEQFVKAAMELQGLINDLSERAVNRYNRLTEGRNDVAPMSYTPLSREGADRTKQLDDLLFK